MVIDLPTLTVAGSFTAAVSGLLLVFAWLQNRESSAIAWWAAANLVLAAGATAIIFAAQSPGHFISALAAPLLNLSPALIWAAARSANDRPVTPLVIAAGPGAGLLLLGIPAFREALEVQILVNLTLVAAYLLAAAAEFWRRRSDRLTSRAPLITLLTLHALIFAGGAISVLTGYLPPASSTPLASWFEFILFETLVFVVGTAIFIVAMDRERGTLRQKIIASIDELTGVANRRAFIDGATAMLRSCQSESLPISLVVFDLDHFKTINDTHGHMAGDRVLEVFADSVRDTTRPGDLIGRPGGEEFAVAMPGATLGTAYVVAERVRVTFAERCRRLGMADLNPTVSAGVTPAVADSTLDTMFAAADRALYRAKQGGRNRIEMATPAAGPEPAIAEELVPTARIA